MRNFMHSPTVLDEETANRGFGKSLPPIRPTMRPEQAQQPDKWRKFAGILGEAMLDPDKGYHDIAKSRRQSTATMDFLRQSGANENELAAAQQSPDVLQVLMKEAFARRTARNAPVKKPSTIQEYEFARNQGYDGSYMDFRKANKGGVTVNNLPAGVAPSDTEFRKKLNSKSAETWADIQKRGNQASAMMGDLDMLEELAKVAPQGPLEGRLAAMFPGFSNAGAAMESIVKRVAPTMRAEGSGSTSDIEYAGMLASLPQLQNRPEANRAIIQMMRAKQQIDMERAQIVTLYQSNQIDQVTALQRMQELNSRSIVTPEMRQALAGLSPQQEPAVAPTAPAAPASGPRVIQIPGKSPVTIERLN